MESRCLKKVGSGLLDGPVGALSSDLWLGAGFNSPLARFRKTRVWVSPPVRGISVFCRQGKDTAAAEESDHFRCGDTGA